MPTAVWALMVAQALALCAMPLIVLIGGIVGLQLSESPQWATLPVAMVIIATAFSVLPAARLAQHWGRKPLFVAAMGQGVLGSLCAVMALSLSSFFLFVVACALLGSLVAVIQQFRFVAMDMVEPDQQAVIASRLLLVGLFSAFVGPELATLAQWWPESGFRASFLALAVLYGLAGLVLWRVLPIAPVTTFNNDVMTGRSWPELFRQPRLWLAVSAGSCGYAIMSYLMTATPLSMTDSYGFSVDEAKWVIQSHIVAMFLPSIASGFLIRRLGHWWVILMGFLVLLVSIAVSWFDATFVHFWGGLVLLGIGWNFLFVAGTALLAGCYEPAEATRVQGMNDALVFGLQAFGALASGAVVLLLGWQGLLLTTLPLLLLLLVVLIRVRPSQLAS